MTLHAKPAENTRLVISARMRSSPSLASAFGSGLGGSRRFSTLGPPLRFSARARMVLNGIMVCEPSRPCLIASSPCEMPRWDKLYNSFSVIAVHHFGPAVNANASNRWRFGCSWPIASPSHAHPSGRVAWASSCRQLRAIRLKALFNFPGGNANQGSIS
jgi:hypothetical protein